jgi:hypothetical protein
MVKGNHSINCKLEESAFWGKIFSFNPVIPKTPLFPLEPIPAIEIERSQQGGRATESLTSVSEL